MSFSLEWSEREAVLSALFAALSTDLLTGESPAALDVYWTKNADSGSFVDPTTQAVCELSTISCVPYGTPQRHTDTDEDNGETRVRIVSHFVWTLRATFYALDTSDPMQSLAWSERIRAGLYRDTAIETLGLIDCGVQRVLPTTSLGGIKRDGRACDVSSFDLVLNTESTYTEIETRPPIEHVEIGAQWNGSEDTPIDFVNVDVEITP